MNANTGSSPSRGLRVARLARQAVLARILDDFMTVPRSRPG
jgi:hypothetical protein